MNKISASGRWVTLAAIVRLVIMVTMLFVIVSVVWTQTEAAVLDNNIFVNSNIDIVTPGDGACTLREAIANANANADTTSGDCVPGSANNIVRFTPTLNGQTITLGGTELVLSSTISVIGPGANLLLISGGDASRVISVTPNGNVSFHGVTIANGRIANGNGGGIDNAGSLTLSYTNIAKNVITSGNVTNGGGIHNSGILTVSHSAVISNTNVATTARGGGIGSTNGHVYIFNSTISQNSSHQWGGGIQNTGFSTLLVDHSTIAGNTAVNFWGGGLLVENNTTATIRNSVLANNQDITGQRDCYFFGFAPSSEGYNVVENPGNCSFKATNDVTGQDARLGLLANDAGPAVDLDGNPISPSEQATWYYSLLADSPAINRIPANASGCNLTISRDQRSYFRTNACDSGAVEYDGIQMTVDAVVNSGAPGPGELITYTFVVNAAASGAVGAEGVILTDILPIGLNYVGPATAVSVSGTVTAAPPPALLAGTFITQGTAVTVTLPITVSIGLVGGTLITNAVFAASAETGIPVTNWQTITVRNVPPIAVSDVYTVLEDSPPNYFAVQNNDFDLNGDQLFTLNAGIPDKGGAAVITDTQIAYSPLVNFNGSELITYTLSDGVLTHTATVSITVQPVNDAPVLAGPMVITQTVDEDSILAPFQFSANDVDGDLLHWLVEGGVGTAVIDEHTPAVTASADITYILKPDFVGFDSFLVHAGDGVLTDTVTISLTVNPVGDPPRAAADVLMITPVISGTAVIIDVLANDVEIDGQALILESVSLPNMSGDVQISDNAVVYTPALTINQTETFTYTVSDGVLTDTETVTVTAVAGLNSGQPGDILIIDQLGFNQGITMALSLPLNMKIPTAQISVIVADATTQVARSSLASPQIPDHYRTSGMDIRLDAYIDGILTLPYTTTIPATMTLTYDEEAFSMMIRGEQDLILFTWDGSSWANSGINPIEFDSTNNRIVFETTQFTRMALFGWNGYPVYLPIILRP